MARVEWSALSGDEVEAVLSNLLYNAHDRALRIRPSQGDFGIDVIVPNQINPKTWDVYQIKKFAHNLTSSQKGQIEASFRRILMGLVRRDVPLNNWYLVTPLDPTLENLLDWFKEVPEEAIKALAADKDLKLTDTEEGKIRAWLTEPGRVIDWKGLDFCQKLASEYPYVVDYYLHGGADRLRGAVADLAQLLGVDMKTQRGDSETQPGEGSAALLEPGEIREHFLRLDRILDTDPHFRYGNSIDVHRPALQPEPGLVAATQESIPGDRWLTFKIYQRSAQSLDERPIPLELEFNFQGSPEDRERFEIWRKFGKPFEAAASFKAELPGGLRREASTARVRMFPAEGGETKYSNRLRIVGPDRSVLAEIRFAMASTRGADSSGVWAHGTDDSGTLDTESFLDATAQSAQVNFTIRPLTGLGASKSLAAVAFASHLSSPNVLQIAGEYGPFHDYHPIPSSEPLVDPAIERFVRALAIIQTRTTTPILIPDLETLSANDEYAIQRAASLIEGHTVVGTWADMRFDINSDIDFNPAEQYQIAATQPLVVPINGQDLVLGGVENTALSARIDVRQGDTVRVVPGLNDTLHINFVPNLPDSSPGRYPVRYRQAADATESAAQDH